MRQIARLWTSAQAGDITLGAPTGLEGWKNWMYGIAITPLEGAKSAEMGRKE